MMSFYVQSMRNRKPIENKRKTNLIKNISFRKKIPLFLNENTTHFYPYNIYIKNNPFPYRTIIKNNNSIHDTENEKYTPYYKKINKSTFYPLVTRQDLLNFIKQKGSPQQRSLPVITGRSRDKKIKIIPKLKTPTLSRNQSSNLRRKIINFSVDEKNRSVNLNALLPIEEKKNETDEECGKLTEIVNEERKEKIISLKNFNAIFYKPRQKTSFRKVQIFNHFKPFLVDEFREYAPCN